MKSAYNYCEWFVKCYGILLEEEQRVKVREVHTQSTWTLVDLRNVCNCF